MGEEAARLHDRPPLLLVRMPGRAVVDGPEPAERLAALTGADGLVLELDPVGEALESGGRVARAEHVAAVCRALAPLPVVVREAGSGLDGADARALQALGAAAVDVGGAGARPAGDPAFAGWGVTLAEAVAEAALMAPDLPLIAGGPLRDGVQAAMCLALGATVAAPRFGRGGRRGRDGRRGAAPAARRRVGVRRARPRPRCTPACCAERPPAGPVERCAAAAHRVRRIGRRTATARSTVAAWPRPPP